MIFLKKSKAKMEFDTKDGTENVTERAIKGEMICVPKSVRILFGNPEK